MSIKFGCHGSTWELDYDKETDYLIDIIDTVDSAGFKGIDVQVALLGRFQKSPESLREELDKRGLELAALTLPFTWASNQESIVEKDLADYYIAYLKHFPNALLNVPSRNGPDRSDLLKRQRDIIQCANAVAKRAHEQGVTASFHPASPPTSYFRTASDYQVLFEELDRRYIGYTPDAGHIAFGGMNPVEVVRENLSIIKHVHFKDCSLQAEWKKMGYGDVDFAEIVRTLTDDGYKGWIMMEEETAEAKINPNQVIHDIGGYVNREIKPIVKGVGQA